MGPDLLIRNGRVLDPAWGVDEVRDLALGAGRVVKAGEEPAARTVDASGCYVLPGLIDFHTHLFRDACAYAVPPELLPPMGVTAAADAGTAGFVNYPAFHRAVVAQSGVRIRSFVSVNPVGLVGPDFHTHYDPAAFDEGRFRRLREAYGDEILGLKLMLSVANVGEDPGFALDLLEATVALADRLGGMRVVVHTTNPPCAAGEIAQRLRPGDVFCHCFHGKGSCMLDENGRVLPEIWAARERGVLFDAANGVSHYSHRVARAALDQGFLPDLIGSDVIASSINLSNRDRGLTHVLSKYLNLGLPLETVVRAATGTPAAAMGLAGEIGTLRPGARADVAVVRVEEVAQVFEDAMGETLAGNRLLVPQMTVLDGEIVYCRPEFG